MRSPHTAGVDMPRPGNSTFQATPSSAENFDRVVAVARRRRWPAGRATAASCRRRVRGMDESQREANDECERNAK